jgi:hypothetical protein
MVLDPVEDPGPATIPMSARLAQAAPQADGAAPTPVPLAPAPDTTSAPGSLVQGTAAVPAPVIIDLTTETTPAPVSASAAIHATPEPVSIAEAEAYVKRLGTNDLRNVLLEMIKSQPEARTTVKSFCNRAVGSKERPFDFASLLRQCQEAAGTASGDVWFRAAHSRDDLDDQGELWVQATEPITDAIEQLAELCQGPTTSDQAKVQAIEALLEIADSVQYMQLDEGQYTNYDQPAFESHACSAIIDAISTFESNSVYATPAFRAVMERFGEYEDLAHLVEEIEDEIKEDEELGRREVQ